VLGEAGVELETSFARVDSDSMRSSADYFAVLSRFARGELRLLLGTQLLKELNPETERARQLGSDLLRAVEAIEDGDVAGSAADALELVSEALRCARTRLGG
jgi:hypothetical protein